MVVAQPPDLPPWAQTICQVAFWVLASLPGFFFFRGFIGRWREIRRRGRSPARIEVIHVYLDRDQTP